MALIRCRECGQEMSDKAPACPKCGCPKEEANPPGAAAGPSQSPPATPLPVAPPAQTGAPQVGDEAEPKAGRVVLGVTAAALGSWLLVSGLLAAIGVETSLSPWPWAIRHNAFSRLFMVVAGAIYGIGLVSSGLRAAFSRPSGLWVMLFSLAYINGVVELGVCLVNPPIAKAVALALVGAALCIGSFRAAVAAWVKSLPVAAPNGSNLELTVYTNGTARARAGSTVLWRGELKELAAGPQGEVLIPLEAGQFAALRRGALRQGLEVWTGGKCTGRLGTFGQQLVSLMAFVLMVAVTSFLGFVAIRTALIGEAPMEAAMVVGSSAREAISNEQQIELRRLVKRNSIQVWSTQQDSFVCGSGFVVDRQGANCILLTNAHVVIAKDNKTAKQIAVRGPSGQTALPARLVDFLNIGQLDFAFLLCSDSQSLLGQPVTLAKQVKTSNFALAVGCPGKEEFLCDDGTVLSVQEDALAPRIAHDALIEHGSSGGGLFNSRGELIGVNTYLVGSRTGVALGVQKLLEGVRFYSYTLNANADGWQESGITVPAGGKARVIAVGSWSLGGLAGSCGPAGATGYAQYTPEKAASHGALVVRSGSKGVPVGVNMWWKNATDDPQAAFCELPAPASATTLWFRCNDSDCRNNSGAMGIIVVVKPW